MLALVKRNRFREHLAVLLLVFSRPCEILGQHCLERVMSDDDEMYQINANDEDAGYESSDLTSPFIFTQSSWFCTIISPSSMHRSVIKIFINA
jgi:hypothetical protein